MIKREEAIKLARKEKRNNRKNRRKKERQHFIKRRHLFTTRGVNELRNAGKKILEKRETLTAEEEQNAGKKKQKKKEEKKASIENMGEIWSARQR